MRDPGGADRARAGVGPQGRDGARYGRPGGRGGLFQRAWSGTPVTAAGRRPPPVLQRRVSDGGSARSMLDGRFRTEGGGHGAAVARPAPAMTTSEFPSPRAAGPAVTTRSGRPDHQDAPALHLLGPLGPDDLDEVLEDLDEAREGPDGPGASGAPGDRGPRAPGSSPPGPAATCCTCRAPAPASGAPSPTGPRPRRAPAPQRLHGPPPGCERGRPHCRSTSACPVHHSGGHLADADGPLDAPGAPPSSGRSSPPDGASASADPSPRPAPPGPGPRHRKTRHHRAPCPGRRPARRAHGRRRAVRRPAPARPRHEDHDVHIAPPRRSTPGGPLNPRLGPARRRPPGAPAAAALPPPPPTAPTAAHHRP
ncbi:hypothetical protein SGRIM128S_08720 [Streptomyces griseomycini]